MTKIVTFDVFDTLVHRRVKAPVDVFEMVRLKAFEHPHALVWHELLARFPEQRIEAESQSRRRRVSEHGGEGEVTLDEIHAEYRLLTGCSEECASALQAIELEIEHLVLHASRRGLELYNEHRAAGHTIALISDMYLPGRWLGAMLAAKGFEGAAQLPVFVSCEVRLSKHTGALYPHVRKALGIEPGTDWLHVGDNLHADIANAGKHGIRTLHADWSKVDNRWVPAGDGHDGHLVDSLLRFLDSPQGAPFLPDTSLERIGYRIFGPLLFGLNAWILHMTRQNRLRRLLFIARDGWLLKQLFEQTQNLVGLRDVETRYFHMSRKTAYQTGMREWDTSTNWRFVGGQVAVSAERSLASANIEASRHVRQLAAFGLDDPALPRGREDHFRVKTLIDTLFEPALRASTENRRRVERYYRDAVGDAGQVGFVDIGWAGTIQKAFAHSISDPHVRDRLTGLYIGTLGASVHARSTGHRLHGWICDGGSPAETEHLLVSGGVELLEFVLTADHGSVLGLRENDEGNIVPVLEDLPETEVAYRAKAMQVQAGVRRFFADHQFLLELYDPESICSTAWAKPFLRMVADPDPVELAELAGLTHSDAPGANDARLPLASRQPWQVRYLKGRRRRARARSFWKAAFDKLNA